MRPEEEALRIDKAVGLVAKLAHAHANFRAGRRGLWDWHKARGPSVRASSERRRTEGRAGDCAGEGSDNPRCVSRSASTRKLKARTRDESVARQQPSRAPAG